MRVAPLHSSAPLYSHGRKSQEQKRTHPSLRQRDAKRGKDEREFFSQLAFSPSEKISGAEARHEQRIRGKGSAGRSEPGHLTVLREKKGHW